MDQITNQINDNITECMENVDNNINQSSETSENIFDANLLNELETNSKQMLDNNSADFTFNFLNMLQDTYSHIKKCIIENHNENSSYSSDVQESDYLEKSLEDITSIIVPKGRMSEKLQKAAPYNFFLNSIKDSIPTHNEPLSVSFQELFDESLGTIVESLQTSFIIDLLWLLNHYHFAGYLKTPLTIICDEDAIKDDFHVEIIKATQPQIKIIPIRTMKNACHHTKIMIFRYDDNSMRIIVSSGNLYKMDWEYSTNGLWISPKLKPLPENADYGESKTGFRRDLISYLSEYNINDLDPWIQRIKKTDFSDIKVFLIASVPTKINCSWRNEEYQWGYPKLQYLLNEYCNDIPKSIPLIAQSSSIGHLGGEKSWSKSKQLNNFRENSKDNWIYKGFGSRMFGHLNKLEFNTFKLIFPTINNAKANYRWPDGIGVFYSKDIHDTQKWITRHMFQWKSDIRYRTKAMPHIKTYCRASEKEGIYWFVLTSANFSRAAWGNILCGSTIQIKNYEVGVLFLPQIMIDRPTFPMITSNFKMFGIPPFPIPYDLPLTQYEKDDEPALTNIFDDDP